MNENISYNRNQLMGYAILMVIVYHYGCWVYNIFGEWNIGFVGVDIFMFLSGWGLTYSYEKYNGLKEFYKKRAVRILPTFYLMYLLIIAYKIISPNLQESLFSIVLELSTLSYWLQTDKYPTDWFLNCIIGYYLLFPLLRKYVGIPLLIILTISVATIDITTSVRWDLASGIDRLPIFVFGIFCAISNFNIKQNLVCCGVILFLFFPISKFISLRLAISFAMFVFLFVCSLTKLTKLKAIKWMGKHSLSLYAANQVTFMFMNIASTGGVLIHSIVFALLQCVFTSVFVLFDKYVSILLKGKMAI